jgi:hypothetical protein
VGEWDLTYYAVTAQVLPTLLIAFILGMRNLRFPRSWFTTWIAIQGILVLGATGAAVWAIRHGGGTEFVDRAIYVSYAFLLPSFAALILRWFVHPDDHHSGRAFLNPNPNPPPTPEPRRSRLSIFLILAAAVIGAVVGRGRR